MHSLIGAAIVIFAIIMVIAALPRGGRKSFLPTDLSQTIYVLAMIALLGVGLTLTFAGW